jgi:hypothetical protein
MFLISHRGNIIGRDVLKENSPEYIENAILKGYDVEIDLRFIGNTYILGHDHGQYEIEYNWLLKYYIKLWIHCKNIPCAYELSKTKVFNFFYHDRDEITLTSRGYLWTYPNKQLTPNSISVLPENSNTNKSNLLSCAGICSDFISDYEVK